MLLFGHVLGYNEGLTVALPKCIFRAAENDDPVGVSVSVSTSGNASLSPTVWPNVFASASVGVPASVSTSWLVSTMPMCCQVFQDALLLACQTLCRPVPRPPNRQVCRQVSRSPPLLACQPVSTNAQAFSSHIGWQSGSFSAFISVSASVSTSFSASILSMCRQVSLSSVL